MRYTLPAFGRTREVVSSNKGSALFAGFSGINTWKPDNSLIVPSRGPRIAYSTSFQDAWQTQFIGGAKFSVDPTRRLWFGATGRLINNFGSEGKKNGKSFGVFAKLPLDR